MIDDQTQDRIRTRLAALTILVTLLLATGSQVAQAQSSANFDLSWHTVANGGGVSSSASFRVNGTAGQALAGPPAATSASFIVTGGYWAATLRTTIYLPAVMRG